MFLAYKYIWKYQVKFNIDVFTTILDVAPTESPTFTEMQFAELDLSELDERVTQDLKQQAASMCAAGSLPLPTDVIEGSARSTRSPPSSRHASSAGQRGVCRYAPATESDEGFPTPFPKLVTLNIANNLVVHINNNIHFFVPFVFLNKIYIFLKCVCNSCIF